MQFLALWAPPQIGTLILVADPLETYSSPKGFGVRQDAACTYYKQNQLRARHAGQQHPPLL